MSGYDLHTFTQPKSGIQMITLEELNQINELLKEATQPKRLPRINIQRVVECPWCKKEQNIYVRSRARTSTRNSS